MKDRALFILVTKLWQEVLNSLSEVQVFYGRPFVWKLWYDIRAVFSHVYLQSFLLHDIRVFFWHVYLHSFLFYGVFSPKYMTIFLQTRIYMCSKKANIYALQTSMCIWGQRKSSYKWHWIIPSQKDPSCTMELKSNFSLKFSLV